MKCSMLRSSSSSYNRFGGHHYVEAVFSTLIHLISAPHECTLFAPLLSTHRNVSVHEILTKWNNPREEGKVHKLSTNADYMLIDRRLLEYSLFIINLKSILPRRKRLIFPYNNSHSEGLYCLVILTALKRLFQKIRLCWLS